MNYEVFENKIKPLMDLVGKWCEEENIEFSSKFRFDDESTYNFSNGFPLDRTDIITMIQHWEVKNNQKLIPEPKNNNDYTINVNINKGSDSKRLLEEFVKGIQKLEHKI